MLFELLCCLSYATLVAERNHFKQAERNDRWIHSVWPASFCVTRLYEMDI